MTLKRESKTFRARGLEPLNLSVAGGGTSQGEKLTGLYVISLFSSDYSSDYL